MPQELGVSPNGTDQLFSTWRSQSHHCYDDTKAASCKLRGGGFPPLHFAARNGHADVFRLLLKARAMVDLPHTLLWPKNTRYTALLVAAANWNSEIYDILVREGGADVMCISNVGGHRENGRDSFRLLFAGKYQSTFVGTEHCRRGRQH